METENTDLGDVRSNVYVLPIIMKQIHRFVNKYLWSVAGEGKFEVPDVSVSLSGAKYKKLIFPCFPFFFRYTITISSVLEREY